MLTADELDGLQRHVLTLDIPGFAPELVLCGGIVIMLLLRLFSLFDRIHLGLTALVITLCALGLSAWQWSLELSGGFIVPDFFTGLLVFDSFTVYLRLFLYSFTALTIWLTLLTGIPDREDSADFYTLLLGATLGMSIMASANHLLMVYIGIEMASVPSYALAGFLKGRRQSSEAALKYVVYGGGASGVMLYGISLLAGKFGTGFLPDIATGFAAIIGPGGTASSDPILLLGTFLVLIGIAFKLAAVPFHFWCPDVFEGASAEVAGFLSVASKGAALALLTRFLLVLSGLGDRQPDVLILPLWTRLAHDFGPALAVFAALTATFGNLAAYSQTNLKRLLAYSTIAHAGYMLMALATMTVVGAQAVLFYLVVYLFMNLGAFAVVAFLRNQYGSEDLSSFRGLIHKSPVLVITLAVFLLSLLGLPPLAGFVAKLQIFLALFGAAKDYGLRGEMALSHTLYGLVVVAGLNTVLSVFYYLNVLKVMILEKPVDTVDGVPDETPPLPFGWAFYSSALATVVLVLGLAWNPLSEASKQGVERFAARADIANDSGTPRKPVVLGSANRVRRRDDEDDDAVQAATPRPAVSVVPKPAQKESKP